MPTLFRVKNQAIMQMTEQEYNELLKMIEQNKAVRKIIEENEKLKLKIAELEDRLREYEMP